MNMNSPVSSIMATDIYTVSPTDTLDKVNDIFNAHQIHHVPVVQFKKLVGIISKADFNKVLHGSRINPSASELDEVVLKAYNAETIMSDHLAKILPEDKIGVAAEIFLDNKIHALPVINDAGDLVGIVTTYDIIRYCFQQAYPNQELESLK
jgi:acetoin utilization protein AcuB